VTVAAAQRLKQGLRALLAFSRPVDWDLARTTLSPELLTLFQRLKRSEQLHSLNVLRGVLAQGDAPHDLCVAALLHDVGKTRYPLAVWQKTFAVLLRAFAPALFKRWSTTGSPANPLQRPCIVSVQHPAWSAEMVAEIGASETAIWLIAQHSEPAERWAQHPATPLLRRLQQADDVN
jgi:hypothetical protein